jgi:hypothetical protein
MWECGNGYIDPRVPDLGPSWGLVVSLTSLPLYPCGNRSRYPLDKMLGGPQSRKFLTLPGLELRFFARLLDSIY